ncbi:MAG TPA: 23S rRNA (pseudouridine(1915)-N(3))-methyltransferase RlmH [Burkholderiales bacterium]|nr:23S rRNA (pseudouridine(1915)-N(3))-methyltransferase RlmH [Burkholderiales bacterium]
MKFIVVAVGHRMPAWIRDGFEEYARRMPREAMLELREVKPALRSRDAGRSTVERLLGTEHRSIAAVLPERCYTVLLDERGIALSTRELAARMTRWREAGRDIAFIVGGADGTAPALRADADLVWSLSRLTLPHGLVRVMLAEQLYRAHLLLSGHPYHRG